MKRCMKLPAARLSVRLVTAVLALHIATAAAAPPGYLHRAEVRQFIAEMVAKHGFVRKELNLLFSRARFQPAIIKSMDRPAGTQMNSWQIYRGLFVNSRRIDEGVQFWNRHAQTLQRAAAEFGVPEEIIVAIIGIETVYGRNVGSYRVIDALSTLAFDYPKRAEFFRSELENYLLFVRDADIDVFQIKGSYAGAIGIPQFMPGSYRRFAIDYDGDGRINLAMSAADAVGSIGNFLKAHGWARGEAAAYPAEVSGENWHNLAAAGFSPLFRVADLPDFGVKLDASLPADTPCALIVLDSPGQSAEYRVGLKNFHVLTRYNRSGFYAVAVLDLGAEIVRSRQQAMGKNEANKENP
jgi:membrane-bound lytic murein transglycosylase B